MGQRSGTRKPHPIEWCTHTSNPITGCKHMCPYCFARRAAQRWSHNDQTVYHRLAAAGQDPFTPTFNLKALVALEQELRRARVSRRVFIGSMSDLGGRWDWLSIPAEGAVAPGGYLVGREHVVALIRGLGIGVKTRVPHDLCLLTKNPVGLSGDWGGTPSHGNTFWIGVSATDVYSAASRTRELLRNVSAPVRWISLEPLMEDDGDALCSSLGSVRGQDLDWIVLGAQTGQDAAPPNVRTAKKVVEWTRGKGIPCFVKNNLRRCDPSENWPMEFPRGGSR